MTKHCPILLNEMIEQMNIQPNGIYIDATWGRGGHSNALLKHLGANGRLMIFDCDHQAIELARKCYEHDSRVCIFHQSFNHFESALHSMNLGEKIDGILFDLGVSSPQLDQAQRGFSFQKNGPLDMRMDKRLKKSAADWVNQASERELANVFFHLGNEKRSWKIARAIVEFRRERKFETTYDLANLITKVKKHVSKHHPATKVFLAIRLYINQELESFKSALKQSLSLLKQKGRVLVITFHSLEDQLVKKFVRYQGSFDRIPLPLMPQVNVLKFLGRSISPGIDEIKINPRSRSAKLRVFEKLI